MAIIRKPLLPFKGRFGQVVFYHLPCGLICRALNPHPRKRILKDLRFAAFRKCSTRMAKASKIASAVYNALPKDFREFWMYRAFVGEALKMLKDKEMTEEQALERLFITYAEVWYIKAKIKTVQQMEPERTASSMKHRQRVKINIRWRECNETILSCSASFIMALAHHFNGGWRSLRSIVRASFMPVPIPPTGKTRAFPNPPLKWWAMNKP